MKTVPFEPAHLDSLECDIMDDLRAALDAADGPAKTIMDGDEPVGAFGIVLKGDTGYSWALFSPALRHHPVALHRTTVREFNAAIRGLKLVYGTVRKDWDTSKHWLQRLGFEYLHDFNLPHGTFELWALKPRS